jgi:hypothetical protein
MYQKNAALKSWIDKPGKKLVPAVAFFLVANEIFLVADEDSLPKKPRCRLAARCKRNSPKECNQKYV